MMLHLEMGGCIPHLETFSQSPAGHFISKKDGLYEEQRKILLFLDPQCFSELLRGSLKA